MEWLLAKVGLQLSEKPGENGLGSHLAVEPRPVRLLVEGRQGFQDPREGLGAGGGAGANAGDWGGDALPSIPPCRCDLALRDNVRAELGSFRPGSWRSFIGSRAGPRTGGFDAGFSLADFDEPTGPLPWERGSLRVAAVAEGEGGDEGSVPSSTAPAPVDRPSGGGFSWASGGFPGEEASRRLGEGGSGEACNRVMVFGDAGPDLATMFQLREPDEPEEGEEERPGGGREGEVAVAGGGTGGGGGLEHTAGDEKLDVVQVGEESASGEAGGQRQAPAL